MTTINTAIVTKKMLAKIIRKAGTQFFTVEFVKKDGKTHRKMNCRKYVSKWLKGSKTAQKRLNTISKASADSLGLCSVWARRSVDGNQYGESPKAAGYRFINLDGLVSATIDGIQYDVVD